VVGLFLQNISKTAQLHKAQTPNSSIQHPALSIAIEAPLQELRNVFTNGQSLSLGLSTAVLRDFRPSKYVTGWPMNLRMFYIHKYYGLRAAEFMSSVT
jgi:hypothetical protein